MLHAQFFRSFSQFFLQFFAVFSQFFCNFWASIDKNVARAVFPQFFAVFSQFFCNFLVSVEMLHSQFFRSFSQFFSQFFRSFFAVLLQLFICVRLSHNSNVALLVRQMVGGWLCTIEELPGISIAGGAMCSKAVLAKQKLEWARRFHISFNNN